jgi:beta-galactosidase
MWQPGGKSGMRRAASAAIALAMLVGAMLAAAPPAVAADTVREGGAGSGAPVREVVQLNRDWDFFLGDLPDASAPAQRSEDWQAINLPHSFSLPYFLGPGFYVGYGWYRKTIQVGTEWRGKRVALEFDGVFQDAEIFVNGERAGRHRGGYTGFTVDLTPHVHTGANLVAVRVNNLWNARLAPRAGEHVFSGGIYRDVRLVVTSPVHVAWYGTWITTPEVSARRATVRIQTEVESHDARARAVTLKSSLIDPAGRAAAQVATDFTILPGTTETIRQAPPALPNPALWEPAHPAMYQLKSELYIDGRLADVFTTPFGVRSIAWTADRGFFLNGRHLYLRGANVHQDQAGWGDAVTHTAARRDVGMIRDAGFNFIRGSHYPHAPAFSQATDELGMLFWSEVPFWGIGGSGGDGNWMASAYPPDPADRPEFEASVLAQSAEMIRIHRNHPSIIAWSTGNEVFFSAPQAMDAMRAFVGRQVAFMRSHDPSRPIAVGGAQRGAIDRLGDIAGYNGDGASLPEYQNPGVASMVSEYGSTIANRPGAYEPGWGNLPDAAGKQAGSGPYPWRFPWRSGEAIWAGFDHGTIASIEFGCMGLIDYFRIPKRQYYWYRNAYAGIAPPAWPVAGDPYQLSLTADKQTITGTQGHDDVQLLVTVRDRQDRALSNSPAVTLSIEQGPGEFPTGRSITFRPDSPIAIRDGQAAITFRSYHAGKTSIRATSPGLRPAIIDIATRGPDPYIDGKTPVVSERQVVNYPAAARVDDAPKNVVLDRPTSASSAAAGHSASMANDGDSATYWQAAEAGAGAAWSADLENIYIVRSVEVVPHVAQEMKFVVEASLDRVNWRITAGGEGRQQRHVSGDFAEPVKARFIRIRFVELPAQATASLDEVRVTGTPAD